MDESVVFNASIKLPKDQRAAFLEAACAGNPQLREQVESLLQEHDGAGSFMERPAAQPPATDIFRPITEGPGTLIGPYKLLQQIGEGGFGVVYMAEQQRPVRRKVALKIIKPGMDTREVIARFESERQALALMDHPNIARVLDAGATDSGRPYFVMELVKGVPITEYCDKNSLPTDNRLALFITVCHAVHHAHQKGVIHRDLKPSNVMVTLHDGQPVPKVIDFGVSKATSQQLTEKTLFTAYGQMIGTPAYMSPEQAEMSGLDIDTRSDTYSLGVLLYELLTGTTPFDGKRLREAGYVEMQRIIREEAPPRPSTRVSTMGDALTVVSNHRSTDPKKLGQQLRGDLDVIVMKAMEKERSRRYDTPNAFADDIQRFLNDEAIVARPASAAYRLKKFAQRNWAAVAAVAAIAAALLLGTTISTWLAIRESRASRLAQIEKLNAEKSLVEAVNAKSAVERERDRAERATAEESNQRQLALEQKQAAEAAQLSATAERAAAVQERDKATALNAELARQKEQQRRMLYVAQMNNIQKAWDSDNVGRVRELLNATRPRPGESDLRGIEWHYWQRMLHQDERTVKLPVQLATTSAPQRGAPTSSGRGGPPGRGGFGFPGGPPGGTRGSAAQEDGEASVRLSSDGTRLAAIVRTASEGQPKYAVKVWNTEMGSLDPVFSQEVSGPTATGGRFTPGDRVCFIDAERVVLARLKFPPLPAGARGRGSSPAPPSPPEDRQRTPDEAVPPRAPFLPLVELHSFPLNSRPDTISSPPTSPITVDAQFAFTLDGLAFTLDGLRIIAITRLLPEGELRGEMAALILDGRTGERIDQVPLPFPVVSSIALSANGVRLAVAESIRGGRGEPLPKLAIVDLTTRATTIVSPFSARTEGFGTFDFGALAFSPSGEKLAAECVRSGFPPSPSEIAVIDAAAGEKLSSIADSSSTPSSRGVSSRILAFSPDGAFLVSSASGDPSSRTLRVWEAATGRLSVEFKGHTSRPLAVAFSAGGTRLVVADAGGAMKVWRLSREILAQSDRNSVAAAFGGGEPPSHIATRSPDSRWTVTSPTPSFFRRGSPDSDVQPVYDLTLEDSTGRVPQRILAPAREPARPQFSPDSQFLAAWSLDPSARPEEAALLNVWSVATGQLAITPPPRFPAATSGSRAVRRLTGLTPEFSPDSRRLVISNRLPSERGPDKPFIRLWDMTSGRELPFSQELPPAGARMTFQFSSDSKLLLIATSSSATPARGVHIYSATTGEFLWKEDRLVTLTAFSPRDAHLAAIRQESAGSGGRAQAVVIWDAATGDEIGRVPLPTNRTVTRLAVNHDGSRVAIYGSSSTTVYDVAAESALYALDGAADYVRFSPDGQRIVTSLGLQGSPFTQGNAARVWDSLTGQELLFATSESPLFSALTATSGSGFAPLSVQAEAEGLIDWLSSADSDGRLLSRSQIADRIKADSSLSDDVRKIAVKLAATTRRSAAALSSQALAVGRTSASPRGEYGRALEWINEALEQAPDNASYANFQGTIFYRLGDYVSALAALERSRNLSAAVGRPPIPAGLRYLAMTHHHLGHPELARKFFYQADRAATTIYASRTESGESAVAQDRFASEGSFSASATSGAPVVIEGLSEAAALLGLRPASELVASAIALRDKQEFDQAIAACNEAVQLDPDSAVAFNLRGLLWDAKKDYQQAVQDFTAALKLDPRNSTFLNHRAYSLVRKRDFDQAITDLDESLRINPRNASGFYYRAFARENKRDYASALSDYDEAIRLSPKSAAVYSYRARVHHNQGARDKALADMQQAIELSPGVAAAPYYRTRASMHSAAQDYDLAIQDHSDAIRLAANDTDHSNRGGSWMRKGEYDKALADFEEALRRIPKNAANIGNRGAVRTMLGQYAAALADLDAALRIDPKAAALHFWRGYLFDKQGQTGQATREYDEFLRLFPKPADGLRDRIGRWLTWREHGKAIADLAELLNLEPENAWAHNNLAWFLATSAGDKLRDGKKAIEHATKACELENWESPISLDTLAAAHAEAGNFADAIKYQEQSLTLARTDAQKAEGESHLALYRDGKPYRQ